MSEDVDPSQAAFEAALFGEDELGVVVRAHIHIEALLLKLLELMVARPEYLKRMELDYAQHVNLAITLGLAPEFARALLALGTLRNVFAHQVGAALSASRVNNLYQALSSAEKDTVQTAYRYTKAQPGFSTMPPFGQLPPKDRFILIAVALRGILLTTIHEMHARSSVAHQGPESTH